MLFLSCLEPSCLPDDFTTYELITIFLYLYKPHPFLHKRDLATIIHALASSQLDYCNAPHVGLTLKTTQELQLVQNAAACLLTGTSRYQHVTLILQKSHWLLLVCGAQFQVLVITYRAMHCLGPGYVKDCLVTSICSTIRII